MGHTKPIDPVEGSPQIIPPGQVRGRSVWIWPILAAFLLGGSGLVRARQGANLQAVATSAQSPPFRLNDLPKSAGHWKAEGDDQSLDAKTIEIAGATGYLARCYLDERTGVKLAVLVAFGPADQIVRHSPLVCFPAVGYTAVGQPIDRSLKIGDLSARLRSVVYAKGNGVAGDRQEAYFGFRHEGIWSPDAAGTRKQFLSNPAMFKIQVQRRVGESEDRARDNPTESLIEHLLPEIEKRISESQTRRTAQA
ncbi:exosortase-associated EpsI family protein [Singulisphaera sp. Ch08]|uniref:Exosortase-associated EpsI family protein n=1 Tax=Singulisphaera sp. Ch08 TaxID=3120278 RepID=A0AAU7CDN7_9BACT